MGVGTRFLTHGKNTMTPCQTTTTRAAKDCAVFCIDWNKTLMSYVNMTQSFVTNSVRELWKLLRMRRVPRPRMPYLPHHPVIHKDKTTTRVRIVYDVSAKWKYPSLNDCLHTGPNFNQKILEITPGVPVLPNSLDCWHWEGFFDDLHITEGLWCAPIPLGEGHPWWGTPTEVYEGSVWSIFYPIPSQCHSQASHQQIPGFLSRPCGQRHTIHIITWTM